MRVFKKLSRIFAISAAVLMLTLTVSAEGYYRKDFDGVTVKKYDFGEIFSFPEGTDFKIGKAMFENCFEQYAGVPYNPTETEEIEISDAGKCPECGNNLSGTYLPEYDITVKQCTADSCLYLETSSPRGTKSVSAETISSKPELTVYMNAD